MIEWMREVTGTSIIRSDARVLHSFKSIEHTLSFMAKNVTRRFNRFDKNIVIDCNRVTIGTFNKARQLIMIHHGSLVQVFCGLSMIIYESENAFSNQGVALIGELIL